MKIVYSVPTFYLLKITEAKRATLVAIAELAIEEVKAGFHGVRMLSSGPTHWTGLVAEESYDKVQKILEAAPDYDTVELEE